MGMKEKKGIFKQKKHWKQSHVTKCSILGNGLIKLKGVEMGDSEEVGLKK